MQHGDIVEYQSDNGTEIGTVIDIAEKVVTVTYPDKPDERRAVSRKKILNVQKRRG